VCESINAAPQAYEFDASFKHSSQPAHSSFIFQYICLKPSSLSLFLSLPVKTPNPLIPILRAEFQSHKPISLSSISTSNSTSRMSPQTVILITGANRGIGKGFVQTYVSRPDTIVVATTRDLESASSKALSSLPTGKGSKIIVVKLDANREEDAQEAVEELKATHGINHIDIVIANAGIGEFVGPTMSTPVSAFQNHFNVNTIGTLTLFQATNSLLEKSASPKFVYISTVLSSIADMEKWALPAVAYGASKAAANYIIRKIHIEHPELNIFSIHPGWVQTDMGTTAAVSAGMEEAPLSVRDSIDGMVSKVSFTNIEFNKDIC
jgi:norsolorinic acid ketoreductase